MKNKLSNLQTLLWAAAILLCLLAMLLSLLFAMSQKSSEARPDGTLTLGQIERVKKTKGGELDSAQNATHTLIPLPESTKGNLDSVFSMTFLADKTLLGLTSYAAQYGDGITPVYWTDDGTGLRAKDAAETQIVFVDGSHITPGSAAMISRPKTVVIYLGADGLAETSEKEFIDGYIRLIDSIRAGSDGVKIIVCSIASVSSNYQGSDGLTPELIARANAWIKQVCIETGVYYADLASFLNDENGYLSDSYLMPNGRSVAAMGIADIVGYFRMHYV